MQNVVGPTLVAMPTTFGLGAYQLVTLYLCLSVSPQKQKKVLLLFRPLIELGNFLA